MQMTPNAKPRDERGAYAVLFALLSITMFGIAALTVDLGNAFARKSDVQGQADFAALAGGQELTSSSPVSTIPSAAVLAAVAKSLNLNQPLNESCTGCVTTSQLVNGDLNDGEVQIILGKGLRVTAPKSTVDRGFAPVIGQAKTQDVRADATVQIFSPGGGSMPMYAAAGCDYGLQTLTDPATGHVASTHDNLAFGADAGDPVISSITEPSPAAIPLTPGLAGPALSVTGTDFVIPAKPTKPGRHVSKIGFFRNDGATVVSADLDPARLADQYFASVAAIPAAVAGVEDVWWVRVYMVDDGPTPGPGVWSSEANAKPLRVGSAQLECEAGASDGNFGTLRLPRSDVSSSQNLPANIASGFQDPLSLVIHEGANSSGLCTPGLAGAVESDEPDRLRPGTNCVGTDPGLPANDAAAGLIEGVGSLPGRLRAATVCGSDMHITLHGSYTINGDTLDCFLTSGTVAAITSPSYSGGTVLSKEIYNSPRFFWVPVIVPDASRGASDRYSIIDFRPAFLTYLHVSGNDIDQIKVTFFNWHALPTVGDGKVSPYLGTGPKVVRLID